METDFFAGYGSKEVGIDGLRAEGCEIWEEEEKKNEEGSERGGGKGRGDERRRG